MKKLSFCIPIKNRFGDIKATLKKNLEDNIQDSAHVEFIVICFDESDEVEHWVKGNFKSQIESGYLRFYRENLKEWHFGKAKNAFKKYISSKIYASLDGDNFTGFRGGNHIVEVFEKYNYQCIFHQFQGDWGDGTCGRISTNADHYMKYGYDDDFLPRQWDEMDAMLTVMVNQPAITYVSYEGINIIRKSHPFKRFLDENQIKVAQETVPKSSCPIEVDTSLAAVGAHDSNYVRDDAKLSYFSVYNHLLSYLKNVQSESMRDEYEAELKEVQNELFGALELDLILNSFLTPKLERSIGENDLYVVSCIKNEPDILKFYEYYKNKGVDFFILIDDGSSLPLCDVFKNHKDVMVYEPKVGYFKVSKVFWLKILLDKYCDGSWVFTVDSDEYAEIHSKSAYQSSLKFFLAETTRQYFSGFMLDFFPSQYEDYDSYDTSDIDNYCYYQFKSGKDDNFEKHNTSKWSYGSFSNYFYKLDIRYRLNNSFDSLRKFPLVKWNRSIILNQGFHDLIIDGVKRKPKEFEECEQIVLRHYKLKTLFSSQDMKAQKSFDGYHNDTAKNLKQLEEGKVASKRICNATPFAYKFLHVGLIPIPSKSHLSIGHKGTCDVVFRKSNSFIPELKFPYLEAYSFEQAVDFIKSNTPFCVVKETSADEVTLYVQ